MTNKEMFFEQVNLLHPGDDDCFEIAIKSPTELARVNETEGFIHGSITESTRFINGVFDKKHLETAYKYLIVAVDILKPEGIHIGLNPVNPQRAVNKFYAGKRCSKKDILRYANIRLEFDPERILDDAESKLSQEAKASGKTTKFMATESEKETAKQARLNMVRVLKDKGLIPLYAGDSGNGYDVVFRVDIPVEEEAIIKDFLKWAKGFNGLVDISNTDPARLTRAFGFENRSGIATTRRPYRLAIMEGAKPEPQVNPKELLHDLKPVVEAGTPKPDKRQVAGKCGPFLNIPAYCDTYGIRLLSPTPKTDALNGKQRMIYALKGCPFDDTDLPGDAAIIQDEDGKLGFHCFHNSCGQYTWADFRAKVSGDDSLLPLMVDGQGNPWVTDVSAYTDVGNSLRLIDSYGADIRYCPERKKWFVWDGKKWGEDNGQVMEMAKLTAMKIPEEINFAGGPEAEARILRHATQSLSQAKLNAMVNLTQSVQDVVVNIGNFDADPWLFNLQNGALDLRDLQFIPHNRSHYSTKMVGVAYDPDATCKLWVDFLDKIMCGDKELVEYLQKIVGLSMTGLTGDNAIFFGYGTGANGKSTFLTVVSRLLGDYAKTASSETFMDRPGDNLRNDLADLKGARFVSTTETEQNRKFAEVVLKMLSGKDKVKCRYLYGEFFEYEPQFKLFIAGNHKPRISGGEYGIWRRIKLIPFNYRFEESERIRDYDDVLSQELPGILNWALEGLKLYHEQGISEPEAVREATKEYKDESDILKEFIDDNCCTGNTCKVQFGELYKEYFKWAESSHVKAISKRSFKDALEERGFPTKAGKGNVRYTLYINIKGKLDVVDGKKQTGWNVRSMKPHDEEDAFMESLIAT